MTSTNKEQQLAKSGDKEISNCRNKDLQNLIQRFKVPIDFSRLNDYKIICFSPTSIRIKDERFNIFHMSDITGNTGFLNYQGRTEFIRVQSIYPDYKIERIYNLKQELLAEQLTIYYDDYFLEIEKDLQHDSRMISGCGIEAKTKYGEKLTFGEREVNQYLIISSYGHSFKKS